ncbi:hypothetical protein ElyMa_006119600 [Elysia marginata]|uniref:Uncharacterized protein n=1 Tax=Elysia marginata TaxID=1093978 RepID=A0AAV4GVW0_9GAST|nr:hypothetical protein ElyMa_006119600 [Elysia marginata]
MEHYRQELEAAAREKEKASIAQSDVAKQSPIQTPSWGVLGDILDQQLKTLELITRASQTDWKWVTMAERWRNARILAPRPALHPPPMTRIVYDLIPATVSLTVCDTDSKSSGFRAAMARLSYQESMSICSSGKTTLASGLTALCGDFSLYYNSQPFSFN